MIQERIVVRENDSTVAELGGIIVTAGKTLSGSVELVVGRPGQPNLVETLKVGSAVLYETPEGLFEVRALKTTIYEAIILISEVAGKSGLAAGYVDQDQSNVPFTPAERLQLKGSIKRIGAAMTARDDVAPEQLAFIEAKLAEMEAAADRMGRKDWINLALGTLTGIVASTALETAAAKALFHAADSAFSWLFTGAMRLLS